MEIVPLEVIVRNVAAGSFSKRLGIEEGRKLLAPTLEFSYKDDDLGDPLINDYLRLPSERLQEKRSIRLQSIHLK